jgi:glycosyltransferase involved in cell wall biosynthesis
LKDSPVVKIMVLGIRGMPNVPGGVETHAEHLYARLAALGCSVEALVRSPFVAPGQRYFGAIRLRRLWSPRRNGLEALIHSVLGVLYAAVVRPDILHIHAIGPAIVTPIARILGLKVVVTHHGPDYEREKWGHFARFVLRAGERLGMKYANERIAISQVIADRVRVQYGRDCTLIPNGVVPVMTSSDSSQIRRFNLDSGRYFLQVSRLVPEKRQLDLIRAFVLARCEGWKLALVGALTPGAYSEEVVAAAKSAGVVLTGFQHGEPLRQLYSHAGAFILPSSHEGLPIAMLEALSYGLPVVASDIPANIEVGLETSSYFPLGDITTLAAALVRQSQIPQEESVRSARKKWVAEKYDWGRIAEETLDVYRKTMGG